MEARLSPGVARHWRVFVSASALAAAVIGLLIGIANVASHMASDPLADVHAYYDAAARLNAGLPLYEQAVDTNAAAFYRYPPLLAIAFRPLALLPFPVAATIWDVGIVAAFAAAVLLRAGPRPRTAFLLAILALPIGWSVVIGQAQVLVTALLLVGSPAAVAVAGHLKLLPFLVALWWIGRREWRPLGRFVAWTVALAVVQLILEPAGTLAYLRFPSLAQVGDVNNLSPFAISPLLWAGLVAVGALVTIRLAPTRYGWPAAIAFSVLATPRLLSYQLSTLVAGLRRPEDRA
ncbi:MAG: glycosyltransferase 87 family protein [Chloroflexota bacterium]